MDSTDRIVLRLVAAAAAAAAFISGTALSRARGHGRVNLRHRSTTGCRSVCVTNPSDTGGCEAEFSFSSV